MGWYSGKKLFITGGSSGIGKCLALQAARDGASVAIVARGQERLDAVLAELNAIGGKHFAYALDISDLTACETIVAQAISDLGGLDILINNAGVAHPGYIDDLTDDIFVSMMNINYFGTVNVTRAALPHFKKQRSGHISMVSSVLGYMGVFGYTAYAASKFAVVGFAECLRQELLTFGVDVSVVYPADTDTPQFHYENEFKPAETAMLAGNIKAKQPEEVAAVTLRGIQNNQRHIVPGTMNKFIYSMTRHFPGVVSWFMDSDLKKFAKRAN